MLCNKRTDTDMQVCEQTIRTHDRVHTHAHAHTHIHTGTQQEEEEVAAKEVGDEWALSKQHLEQEVPIGRLAWRKEVCLVCVCECVFERMIMCGGGVDVTPWVQLTLRNHNRAV